MSRKWLAKIESVRFGYGGYQDAMFGVSFVLSGEYTTGDFWGTWGLSTKVTEYTKWTEEDRSEQFDSTVRRLNRLMMDAKVNHLDQLVGKPIEITNKDDSGFGAMKSWRILTECI